MINAATRMAGNPRFQKFLQFLKNTVKYGVQGSTNPVATPAAKAEFSKQLAYRLAPDALGGVMVGMTTPGDLGDKVIAGTTDALGGAIGGIGTIGATRGLIRGNRVGNFLVDMGGSYAGAYGSMPIADQLLRMKDSATGGEGLSPYEKLDAERRKQIEQSVIARLGYGPLY